MIDDMVSVPMVPLVANVGCVNMPPLKTLVMTSGVAFRYGVPGFADACAVTVSTCNGVATFCANFPAPTIAKSEIEELMDLFVENLEAVTRKQEPPE